MYPNFYKLYGKMKEFYTAQEEFANAVRIC